MDPIDFALLALRVTVGLTMAAHGTNKVRGGLAGTAGWFESMGMRPGRIHAMLAAGTEIGGGLLFALGLFTPFAGASIVGLMWVAFVTAHRDKGFFVFRPGQGWEYVLVLGMVGVAVGTAGAGKASLDNAFDIEFSDWWGLIISAGLGTVAAAALLGVFWRPPTPAAQS